MRSELDSIILWVDDSQESTAAQALLNQTGLVYEKRRINSEDDTNLQVHPPCLQAYIYRYSGLILLQAMAQYPHQSLVSILEQERDHYMSLIKIEDQFPDITFDWPNWSKRAKSKT